MRYVCIRERAREKDRDKERDKWTTRNERRATREMRLINCSRRETVREKTVSRGSNLQEKQFYSAWPTSRLDKYPAKSRKNSSRLSYLMGGLIGIVQNVPFRSTKQQNARALLLRHNQKRKTSIPNDAAKKRGFRQFSTSHAADIDLVRVW